MQRRFFLKAGGVMTLAAGIRPKPVFGLHREDCAASAGHKALSARELEGRAAWAGR
jgi:hypothetical protein